MALTILRGEPYTGDIPYPVVLLLRMARGEPVSIWDLPVDIGIMVETLRQEMVLNKLM